MKKRNNRNRFNNKNARNDRNVSKRNGSEIKVVSTNVTKEEVKNEPSLREQRSRQRSESSNQNFRRENKFKNTPPAPQPAPRRVSNLSKDIAPFHVKTFEKVKCNFCDKIIEDMSSAIIDQVKNENYHFNCVMNKISSENSVENRERIVYLGSGSFGVIENTTNDSSKFAIKKKIQFVTLAQK